jgi:ectoine hydroxylase-related dioxygenase (phytanoyl-CoA dioxygenase family)
MPSLSAGNFGLMSGLLKEKPLPEDPAVRADIEHVIEHGYVIIPDCFTKAEAQEARDEIQRLLGESPLRGRNSFEGLNTNRIYPLLNKSRVLALNDYFLDANYLLTAFHTISINPGEKAQGLHHDDGYIQVPRPRAPFGSAIMVALDEYTAENGATRIIPGSHTWGSDRSGSPEETVPTLVPEGGVVYFISTLIHGGGANISNKPRQSATVQYCQPYIRPIENQILAVDPRKLDEIDPKIVELMGYKTMDPFMGYADGLNPRRAAARMVRWIQSEVEQHPPTFAHDAREYKL